MISFGSKAETLEKLKPVISSAVILPQICFTADAWENKKNEIESRLQIEGWFDIPVIARSSSLREDGKSHSYAGAFLSIPSVVGRQEVVNAVGNVMASFGTHQTAGDQIFLQPMLENVIMSGVAFSRDPNTGGHYRVINYDNKSGTTCSITSGSTNDIKTFYFFKGNNTPPSGIMGRIIALIEELESIFQTDLLDIEFAYAADGELYLLQVRPLTMGYIPSVTLADQIQALNDIERKFIELNRMHPYLHGKRTMFGLMPDWNPAEIVGVRPRPLALSLYREIITDSIWAYQRDNYGYKNVRSFPLIIAFQGIPFIDVRVSFNSFIPSDIEASIAEKLVEYYIKRLIEEPANHDKVEFNIVFTCFTFDLQKRMEQLNNNGFSADETEYIRESLRKLTNNIITGNGLWKKDILKIEELEKRHDLVIKSDMDTISQIYWLIEDCKRYGTLPFAGLARAGFIAVQMLNSLVNIGIITTQERAIFLESVDSVSSQMTNDLMSMERNDFLRIYGHLRPGTYDILSPRYDENPDLYFRRNNQILLENREKTFKLSLKQIKEIDLLLKNNKIDHDVITLFDFIEGAIKGREYSKFAFTKNLSDTISLIAYLANQYKLSRDNISYADIVDIMKLYSSGQNMEVAIKNSIEKGRSLYRMTSTISLPPLIADKENIWSFHVPESEPNFITMKRVSAEVRSVEEAERDFQNAIIFIPSADPGYDWIFSRGIVGMVTMYGGINSHMAIRAGELGIPAVIGAGETNYKRWLNAKVMEIDCTNKQVRIIQ